MDFQARLLAAADMCEAGEEVNLDELMFLLRYAADELADLPKIRAEHERLMEALRCRVLARCDLLERGEKERQRASKGTLDDLEELEEKLDIEVRQRFQLEHLPASMLALPNTEAQIQRFHSGR